MVSPRSRKKVDEPAAREPKPGLHPRNRHRARYDFPLLTTCSPGLRRYLSINPYGDESIDFADPAAVKALNQALLAAYYDVPAWDIPEGYLCPPIPGRADYIHHAADLLASCHGGVIPRGPSRRILDVGVGANCIYPIIGQREYGWSFLGCDIDPAALENARRIVGASPGLEQAIAFRLQPDASRIFKGILREGEQFDLTVCNPPFHASLADAREGTQRKWRNLRKNDAPGASPRKNFGGTGRELWCPGGEEAFIGRMIEESTEVSQSVFWFSTLVSKAATLPTLRAALRKAGTEDIRVIEMAQGQKKSRILGWTFLAARQREQWRSERWLPDTP